MPRMLGFASKRPFQIGKPKARDLVNSPETISDAYAYYKDQYGTAAPQAGEFYKYPVPKEARDYVEMVASQAGTPNAGRNVLDMLAQRMYGVNYNDLSAVQTMMGRNPVMQARIKKGAAPLADAYYRMQNIGLPKDQMLTGRDRLRAVSKLLNSEGVETALRGVPIVGTAAAGLGTLAAIDAVTESPEERQIREALAAIQYMGG